MPQSTPLQQVIASNAKANGEDLFVQVLNLISTPLQQIIASNAKANGEDLFVQVLNLIITFAQRTRHASTKRCDARDTQVQSDATCDPRGCGSSRNRKERNTHTRRAVQKPKRRGDNVML